LNDEHASGYAQAKTDIDAIIEARGGDVAAGYQAFKDGKTVQEAKNEHARSLEQQLAEAKAEAEQLKAKIEADQDGVDPIELNAGAEIDEPTEGDEKVAKVKSEANKITNEYARNAYIASMGFDPNDFKFD
jgi:chromosome segregation ATPase